MAEADPFSAAPKDLIDLERYPLDQADARGLLVRRCREELARESCVTLPGFVRAAAVKLMAAEAAATGAAGYRRYDHLTPYGPPSAEDLPDDDPRKLTSLSSMQAVPGDLLDPQGGVRRLYGWDGLTRTIAEILGEPVLHRVADPMFNCNFSIAEAGGTHHWHFDGNDFVITLLLQEAERGGAFEFAPYIRNAEAENYAEVSALMRGDRSRVRQLTVAPGTLMLFCGKYTVHRVSPVAGGRARMIAIFSYDRRPNMWFSDASAARVFGRTRDSTAMRGMAAK